METFERIAKALEGIESALYLLADKSSTEKYGEKLIEQYGRYVEKSVAAEILGVSRQTVYAMLADGRLTRACNGKRVDVQSIAAYMGSPDEPEENAIHAESQNRKQSILSHKE